MIVTRTQPVSKVIDDDRRNEKFLVEILEWHVNAGDAFSKGVALCSIKLHLSENYEPEEVDSAWPSHTKKSGNVNLSLSGIFGAIASENGLKPGKRKIKASFDGVFVKTVVSTGEKVRLDSVLAKIYAL